MLSCMALNSGSLRMGCIIGSILILAKLDFPHFERSGSQVAGMGKPRVGRQIIGVTLDARQLGFQRWQLSTPAAIPVE